MKTANLVFVSLPLLICSSMALAAQGLPSPLEKVENSIKHEHPGWKLASKDLQGKEVIYRWELEKGGVRLLIFFAASRREAVDKMNNSLLRISVGPKAKLKAIGEEAYFWSDDNSGYGVIRFRKSNVYVDVVAPSATLAEELARSVDQLIQSK
jgi:hypothetical protein